MDFLVTPSNQTIPSPSPRTAPSSFSLSSALKAIGICTLLPQAHGFAGLGRLKSLAQPSSKGYLFNTNAKKPFEFNSKPDWFKGDKSDCGYFVLDAKPQNYGEQNRIEIAADVDESACDFVEEVLSNAADIPECESISHISKSDANGPREIRPHVANYENLSISHDEALAGCAESLAKNILQFGSENMTRPIEEKPPSTDTPTGIQRPKMPSFFTSKKFYGIALLGIGRLAFNRAKNSLTETINKLHGSLRAAAEKNDVNGMKAVMIRAGSMKFLQPCDNAYERMGKANCTLRSTLTKAIKSGQPEVATLLIDFGVNLNRSYTAANPSDLHKAAAAGNTEVVQYLLNIGFSVDLASEKCSPLQSAIKHGNKETVSALLDAGASVKTANEMRHTPLYYAELRGDEEILKILADHETNIDKS